MRSHLFVLVVATFSLVSPLRGAEFLPIPFFPVSPEPLTMRASTTFDNGGLSENGSVVLVEQYWAYDQFGNTGVWTSGHWSRDSGVTAPFEEEQPYFRVKDVSGDGLEFVGDLFDNVTLGRAFRLRPGRELTLLEPPPGYEQSIGSSISRDGSVVVGTSNIRSSTLPATDSVNHPTYWNADGEAFLLTTDMHAEANRVSADGAVIIGEAADEQNRFRLPFRWSDEDQFQILPTLPGAKADDSYRAHDVSADGRWTVGRVRDVDGVWQALLWDGLSDPQPLLPAVEGPGTAALDISDDGTRVLGAICNAECPPREVAIWTEATGFVLLRDMLVDEYGLGEQLAGWSFGLATEMSGDGRYILGDGTNPDGQSQAWLVDLGPTTLLEGDYNNNGTVEQGDLDLVLLNWGAVASTIPDAWANDLPTDTVDQDELDGVLLNWGAARTNLNADIVPEPTAVVLAVFMAAAALLMRPTRSPGHCVSP